MWFLWVFVFDHELYTGLLSKVQIFPFHFVPFRYVSFGFIPFGFIPFGFVPFGFIPFGFIPFGFIPFGFVPFRFVPFCFLPFRFAKYNKPDKADRRIFKKRSSNAGHPLNNILPKHKETKYNLRVKSSHCPKINTPRFRNAFVNRLIFKYNLKLFYVHF